MGKLTVKEAEQLKKEGLLTDETFEEMQKTGMVGRKARGTRKVMKTKNNSYVTPQFYFRGLSKNGNGEYSKKMEELHSKVHELFNKYTTEQKVNKDNK